MYFACTPSGKGPEFTPLEIPYRLLGRALLNTSWKGRFGPPRGLPALRFKPRMAWGRKLSSDPHFLDCLHPHRASLEEGARPEGKRAVL